MFSTTLAGRSVRKLSGEQCEARLCLSAVTFLPHRIVGGDAVCCSLISADLDSDGDIDAISASTELKRIVWYENIDGSGNFGKQQVLAVGITEVETLLTVDVDGDDDVDILSASTREIAWYENTDGKGNFGPKQLVTDIGWRFTTLTADVDGDGDIDVLASSLREIVWYENTDGLGSFAEQRVVANEESLIQSVNTADVDGDGDVDVVSTLLNRTIVWYSNTDGNGRFGPRQSVADGIGFRSQVFAADVDNDGDTDLISSTVDGIAWYENSDGVGTFGRQRVITTMVVTHADAAAAIKLVDMDRDGDVDVVAPNTFSWHENTDGVGTFRRQNFVEHEFAYRQSISVADVDGDGDADVLALYDSGMYWHENSDGAGKFGEPHSIVPQVSFPESVFAADLDGDGDLDVLSASLGDDKIAWYENEGDRSFGTQRIITTGADQAQTVLATDLDGDGDADVLWSAKYEDNIAWFPNTDGNGNFGEQRVINRNEEQAAPTSALSIHPADLDGDGDLDVFAATQSLDPNVLFDEQVFWFENTDGAGTFSGPRGIGDQAESTFVADLDGDGDLDVLAAARYDSMFGEDKIVWYENTDGTGRFGGEKEISIEQATVSSVLAADIDSDGDADVLWTTHRTIAWFENDGDGKFGESEVITDAANGSEAIVAADVDGDGDIDLISASHYDDKLVWFENLNGEGDFGEQRVVDATSDGIPSAFAADLDGDGDTDLLSASRYDNSIAWYENRLIGDSNDDGLFDSSDLVTAFTAAKYEDQVAGNASFEEGDWNQDGDFDSSDLVLAFEAGHYATAAVPLPSEVEAAVEWLFAQKEREDELSALLPD